MKNGAVKLIVACSEKMAQCFPGGHPALICKLADMVMRDDMTKEKMLEHRRTLLCRMPERTLHHLLA